MIDAYNKLAHRARVKRRRLLAVLGTPAGEALLAELENHFEVHLPVFQGKPGGFDPLDAMRRDAHREVFLVIRGQLALARQEANTDTEQHEPNPTE